MRLTDSENCKDVINKDIDKKTKKNIADLYKSMFENIMAIMPDEYRDMFVGIYDTRNYDENE